LAEILKLVLPVKERNC